MDVPATTGRSDVGPTRLVAVRGGLRRWWPVVLAVAVMAVLRAASVVEGDIFWSARAGMESWAGAPYVRPDTWSWAPLGQWTQNSYGWNLVLGAVWQGGHFWGLFALGVLVASAILGGLAWLAYRGGASILVAGYAVVVAAVLATPVLTIRAVSADALALMVALALTPAVARRAARGVGGAAVAVAAAFGFSAVGVNLHLGWPIVVVPVVACFAVALWLLPCRGWGWAARVGAVGASAGAGVLCSPLGVGLLAHSAHTAQVSRPLISEWQPGLLSPMWAPLCLAGFVLAWWARRHRDLLPLVPPLLILCAAGLYAQRFALLAGLLVVIVAAVWATRAPRTGFWDARGRTYRGALLVLLATCAIVAAPVLAHPGVPPQAEAVAALPRGCRLFSHPNHGGAVVLLRPDVHVFVDGRNDYWGLERYLRTLQVLAGYRSSPADQLQELGATCVLASTTDPDDATLLASLTSDPRWSRVAITEEMVTFARTAGR